MNKIKVILNTVTILSVIIILLSVIDALANTKIFQSLLPKAVYDNNWMSIVVISALTFSVIIKIILQNLPPKNYDSIHQDATDKPKDSRHTITTIGVLFITIVIHAFYFFVGSLCGFDGNCTGIMTSIAIGLILSLWASWNLSKIHYSIKRFVYSLVLYVLANLSAILFATIFGGFILFY